ncbi:ras-like protein isoform X2 [Varroa jacobsoni]|uniref:GTP-binding protein Rhes n=1 Tax=Varroa destructor TaxID=109461 RepID=A0A7M7KWS5_VARDE|nr:ras-like protein isoform X2 [Varroa destructor]XP_022686996.1 ras-like protein isoform X2 [Varroa jacobsoni]
MDEPQKMNYIPKCSLTVPISNEERFHRLVLLGPSGVGKTSLIRRILYNVFDPIYRPTLEESHRKVLRVQELVLNLDIIDTSGSPEFPAMRELALQKGEGFVLVFSFDQPSSLDEIALLRDSVRAVHPNAFILVVGNKSDLPSNKCTIQLELAESLVSCDWELPFVNCSARTGDHVACILEQISEVWGVGSANVVSPRRGLRRQSMPPVFRGAYVGQRRFSVMRNLAKRKSCMVQ